MRFVIRRAIKSVKLYPLPITTSQDALLLDGVGNFVAGKIVKWRSEESGGPGKENSDGSKRNQDPPSNAQPTAKKQKHNTDNSSFGSKSDQNTAGVYVPAFKKGAQKPVSLFQGQMKIEYSVVCRTVVCASFNVACRSRHKSRY
jgi:hypothetical protein